MGTCLIFSGWVRIWEGTCQNVGACLFEEIIYGWSVLRNHETFEMGLYPVCFINLVTGKIIIIIIIIILLHEKFLQFDWLRAVVFQLNLKYLHVKITNLLRVVE